MSDLVETEWQKRKINELQLELEEKQSSDLYRQLGNVLALGFQTVESLAQYEKGLKIDDKDPRLLNAIGRLHIYNFESKKALPYLMKGLSVDPTLPQLWRNIDLALFYASRDNFLMPPSEYEPRLLDQEFGPMLGKFGKNLHFLCYLGDLLAQKRIKNGLTEITERSMLLWMKEFSDNDRERLQHLKEVAKRFSPSEDPVIRNARLNPNLYLMNLNDDRTYSLVEKLTKKFVYLSPVIDIINDMDGSGIGEIKPPLYDIPLHIDIPTAYTQRWEDREYSLIEILAEKDYEDHFIDEMNDSSLKGEAHKLADLFEYLHGLDGSGLKLMDWAMWSLVYRRNFKKTVELVRQLHYFSREISNDCDPFIIAGDAFYRNDLCLDCYSGALKGLWEMRKNGIIDVATVKSLKSMEELVLICPYESDSYDISALSHGEPELYHHLIGRSLEHFFSDLSKLYVEFEPGYRLVKDLQYEWLDAFSDLKPSAEFNHEIGMREVSHISKVLAGLKTFNNNQELISNLFVSDSKPRSDVSAWLRKMEIAASVIDLLVRPSDYEEITDFRRKLHLDSLRISQSNLEHSQYAALLREYTAFGIKFINLLEKKHETGEVLDIVTRLQEIDFSHPKRLGLVANTFNVKDDLYLQNCDAYTG